MKLKLKQRVVKTTKTSNINKKQFKIKGKKLNFNAKLKKIGNFNNKIKFNAKIINKVKILKGHSAVNNKPYKIKILDKYTHKTEFPENGETEEMNGKPAYVPTQYLAPNDVVAEQNYKELVAIADEFRAKRLNDPKSINDKYLDDLFEKYHSLKPLDLSALHESHFENIPIDVVCALKTPIEHGANGFTTLTEFQEEYPWIPKDQLEAAIRHKKLKAWNSKIPHIAQKIEVFGEFEDAYARSLGKKDRNDLTHMDKTVNDKKNDIHKVVEEQYTVELNGKKTKLATLPVSEYKNVDRNEMWGWRVNLEYAEQKIHDDYEHEAHDYAEHFVNEHIWGMSYLRRIKHVLSGSKDKFKQYPEWSDERVEYQYAHRLPNVIKRFLKREDPPQAPKYKMPSVLTPYQEILSKFDKDVLDHRNQNGYYDKIQKDPETYVKFDQI